MSSADRAAPSGDLTSNQGWYPLVAMTALAAAEQLAGYPILALMAEMAADLNTGTATVRGATVASLLIALALSIAFGRWARNRALAIVAAGAAWVAGSALLTLAGGRLLLFAGLALRGLGAAPIAALHRPLLCDSYPTVAWARVLAIHRAGAAAGLAASALLVGAGSALHWTWATIFAVATGAAGLLTLLASGLREPPGDQPSRPGFATAVRDLTHVRTARVALGTYMALGVALGPGVVHIHQRLRMDFGVGTGASAMAIAVIALAAAGSLVLAGSGRRAGWPDDPRRLIQICSMTLAVGALALVSAVALPTVGVLVAGSAIGLAAVLLVIAGLDVTLMGVVPREARAHAATLSTLFALGVGALGGAIVLAAVESRLGHGWAIATVALALGAGSVGLRPAADSARCDLEAREQNSRAG